MSALYEDGVAIALNNPEIDQDVTDISEMLCSDRTEPGVSNAYTVRQLVLQLAQAMIRDPDVGHVRVTIDGLDLVRINVEPTRDHPAGDSNDYVMNLRSNCAPE